MHRYKIKKVDLLIYSFIVLSSFNIICKYISVEKNFFVYMTQLAIGIISFLGAIIDTKTISIKRTINIFSYIFMFLAPWQQYSEGITLWKSTGLSIAYSDLNYIKTNIILIVSLIIFNLSYRHFRRKGSTEDIISSKKYSEIMLSKQSKIFLVFIGVFSFLILIATKKLTGQGVVLSNSSLNSQLWNIIRVFPICAIIAYGMVYKKWNELRKQFGFLVLLIIFLVIYFPFWGNMARFMLLGGYVMLLSIWKSNTKTKSWFFLVYYIGFTTVFSSIRRVTNISSIFNATQDFCHVDYDAHQMMMATVKYTDVCGINYGKSIISALAFIVPRSIWHGKMHATGSLVMSYYDSWFTNTSSPIYGEVYFALGWIGVIVVFFLLGYIISIIDKWESSKMVLKKGIFCVLSGMTIYICRGSLLPAMAYTLGIILALYIISIITKLHTIEFSSKEKRFKGIKGIKLTE